MSEAVLDAAPASAEATEAPVATQETQATEPPKYKVKLPDGEREVDIDELLAGYQLKQASYKKFEEASAKERAAAEKEARYKKDFINALLEDPDVGKAKFKDEVIKFLYNEFSEEEMTPEQRKAKAYDEMLAKQREEQEASLRAQEEAEEAAEVEKLEKQLIETFTAALDTVALPRTTSTVRTMAHLQQVMEDKGYEPSPKELAQITRDTLIAEQNEVFRAYRGEKLLQVIHPDVLQAIREADLERIRAKKGGKSNVDAYRETKGEKRYALHADGKPLLSPEEALKRFLGDDA